MQAKEKKTRHEPKSMTANASETSDTSGSDNDQASDKDEGRRLSFEVVADLTADGSSLYTYRDFSNVAEEELEDVSASLAPPSHHGRAETSIRCQKFPVKLYAILAQKEFNEIITWQPHGRAWKVLEPQSFERLVMPLFFEYSNYHSFNRLVNAWSFRRISSGPDRGSYYHELFLCGKPQLQKFMRRLPKTHKKLPMKKKDEPNFYDHNKIAPLPGLNELSVPTTSTLQHMKRPTLRASGMRQTLLPFLATSASELRMRETSQAIQEQSHGLNPNWWLNPRLGALSSYGAISQLSGTGALGRLGGMCDLGSIGGLGSTSLAGLATGVELGSLTGAQGFGAALRASQLGSGFGLCNPTLMNLNQSGLGRYRELEALGIGANR